MSRNQEKTNQQCKAVLKVRATVLNAARSWLNAQEYIEVQGPIILPAVGKRPHNFMINYFDQSAYLSGGLQPYSDTLLEMFGKIFTIAPTFRAERLKTSRHLTEYWRIEVAALRQNFERIIRIQEELVAHLCSELAKNATEELSLLQRPVDDIKQVKTPFPRLTYDAAIEKLQSMDCKVNWGESLSWELESKLGSVYNQPFFVTEFPLNGETFFNKAHAHRGELTLSADLIAPEGYGEFAGAAETITDKRVLLKKLKEAGIEPRDRRWYLRLRRLDSAPQSGFALGVERLLQWICKLEHIKEATAFPRTYGCIYP